MVLYGSFKLKAHQTARFNLLLHKVVCLWTNGLKRQEIQNNVNSWFGHNVLPNISCNSFLDAYFRHRTILERGFVRRVQGLINKEDSYYMLNVGSNGYSCFATFSKLTKNHGQSFHPIVVLGSLGHVW